jgi:carboxyl-terminal processing protease
MMKTFRIAPLIALLLLPVMVGTLAAATPVSGKRVFDRTVEIVNKEFYRPKELGPFNQGAREILSATDGLDGANAATVDATIAALLASLNTSHTARYTADRVDYYELLDVFRFNYRRDLGRLYPPEGEIKYDGVGMATRRVDGKVFVSDVYDGGPAWRASVKTGDEILAADGAPFAEIGSFDGKAGKNVEFTLRRKAGGPEINVKVRPEKLQPSEALLEAIEKSVRVIDREGKRIGYVRIWAYTRNEVSEILSYELGGGRLANVDGLVLDLRSRWGGAPADAAEIFVGDTPEMRMIENDGEVHYTNTRWRKPVVAIIDEGTRSGMEILANALKLNGIPLVGAKTAGAVVAGRGFLLPDDSLLVVAVADVLVDGGRLEGKPVEPDIAVPFDLRYADGADPQLDAALGEMAKRLSEG